MQNFFLIKKQPDVFMYTVKLGFKELLNKEQIGFKELFTDNQLFYLYHKSTDK